jgi:hypothetical protein
MCVQHIVVVTWNAPMLTREGQKLALNATNISVEEIRGHTVSFRCACSSLKYQKNVESLSSISSLSDTSLYREEVIIPQTLAPPLVICKPTSPRNCPSTSHSAPSRGYHPSNADAPGSLEV